jgi:regulatory protein YycI of two-component signal transduction system YycFG
MEEVIMVLVIILINIVLACIMFCVWQWLDPK